MLGAIPSECLDCRLAHCSTHNARGRMGAPVPLRLRRNRADMVSLCGYHDRCLTRVLLYVIFLVFLDMVVQNGGLG